MSSHNRDRGLPHGGFKAAQRPHSEIKRTQPQKMHNSDKWFLNVIYTTIVFVGVWFMADRFELHNTIDSIGVFSFIIGSIVLVIAPSLIAHKRKHNNLLAICVTNILLGWTGVVWFGCLIWSMTDNVKNEG